MADTVTSLRVAASLILLALPLRSACFLVAYTLTGLTDVLDGWLARKTGTAASSAQGWTVWPTCCFTASCCSGFSRFCGRRFR